MNLENVSVMSDAVATVLPADFEAGAVEAGIKYSGRLDLGVLFSRRPSVVAGTFTRNRVKAAPVLDDITLLRSSRKGYQAIVVNSGNANACTGEQGLKDSAAMREAAAKALSIMPEQVLVCSTGVIGQPLPMDRIIAGISSACARLQADSAGLAHVASAIMTTDTRPKVVTAGLELGGARVSVTGIAKGAGMIAPDMAPHATMLSFIMTDAEVEPNLLQSMLNQAVDGSFNSITVDGDTSTNDTVLLMANGASGQPVVADSLSSEQFFHALNMVCCKLARMIVEDGEGATRCVEIQITGARARSEARAAAKVIAESPLVKTAIYGRDPNWGRIVAAAGRSGAELAPERLSLWFDNVQLLDNGNFSGEGAEEQCRQVMTRKAFSIRLDLGVGQETASMLTCDLSVEYIHINADYRT